MTATWDFDPTQRVIRSKFVGKVDDEDLMNHQRMAALLVSSLDPLAAIVDLSGAEPFEATSGGMRRLARLPPPMPKVDRPRVVVAPKDHVYEMMRIFAIEGEPARPNLHVVRTMAEACRIIGVDEAEVHFQPLARSFYASC